MTGRQDYMNWRSIVRRRSDITQIRYEEVPNFQGNPGGSVVCSYGARAICLSRGGVAELAGVGGGLPVPGAAGPHRRPAEPDLQRPQDRELQPSVLRDRRWRLAPGLKQP
jgi:hypothetical protein